MALRHSRMTELGAAAPDFALPDPSGAIVKKSDYAGRPLLVAFICNHCKYVQHIRESFAAFAREYAEKGLAIVAISANDVSTHPDDRPEENARVARQFGFVFPYLHDETQETALAYEAICTPDFFLLDKDGRLIYRGRFDEASPGNGKPVTGADLRAAADAVLEGRAPAIQQNPSMGCSIKWKADRAPAWG